MLCINEITVKCDSAIQLSLIALIVDIRHPMQCQDIRPGSQSEAGSVDNWQNGVCVSMYTGLVIKQ